MDLKIVTINAHEITNWKSFHDVFKRVFGFPDFYGYNMDAWIDCMADLDENNGMTSLAVEEGGLVALQIEGWEEFQERCPKQYSALLACAATVNENHMNDQLRTEKKPILAIVPVSIHRD